MPTTTAFKAFTHDLRPPVQGGEPVWDGVLPYPLPRVAVDRSARECAAGWNACRAPETALRIAGLWPNGRPSRLFEVRTDGAVVERDDKLRAETWMVVRELGEAEVEAAVARLTATFGVDPIAKSLVTEQMEWRRALARPGRDRSGVEAGLRAALAARGLAWRLREFPSIRDARAARDAWTARDAWDAWDARAARDAWTARAAWTARDAWDAWDARDAWDAWAARAGLAVYAARTMKWSPGDPSALTTGLRDAYRAGLGTALPTGPGELGWTMGGAP